MTLALNILTRISSMTCQISDCASKLSYDGRICQSITQIGFQKSKQKHVEFQIFNIWPCQAVHPRNNQKLNSNRKQHSSVTEATYEFVA